MLGLQLGCLGVHLELLLCHLLLLHHSGLSLHLRLHIQSLLLHLQCLKLGSQLILSGLPVGVGKNRRVCLGRLLTQLFPSRFPDRIDVHIARLFALILDRVPFVNATVGSE